MQKKEMYKVSEAINVLDPSLSKQGGSEQDNTWNCTTDGSSTQANGNGVCQKGNSNQRSLKVAFGDTASKDATTVDNKTASNISQVMTGTTITRDQKGVVSSAFAKAHEGAEIVNFLEATNGKICVGTGAGDSAGVTSQTAGKCHSGGTSIMAVIVMLN